MNDCDSTHTAPDWPSCPPLLQPPICNIVTHTVFTTNLAVLSEREGLCGNKCASVVWMVNSWLRGVWVRWQRNTTGDDADRFGAIDSPQSNQEVLFITIFWLWITWQAASVLVAYFENTRFDATHFTKLKGKKAKGENIRYCFSIQQGGEGFAPSWQLWKVTTNWCTELSQRSNTVDLNLFKLVK